MSLTLEDLKNIENIIDLKINPLVERLDTFVTKNEFYTFADAILSRFDRLETEYFSLTNRVLDHEERLAIVESKVS